MTDNEIVKDFEEQTNLIGSMTNVHLDEDKGLKLYMVMRNILILINRRNSEIERLQDTLDDVLDRQPLLVERTEKYAKSEARKEFVKDLKERAYRNSVDELIVFEEDIDNLLKEMESANND